MADIDWTEINEKLIYEKGEEGKAKRKVFFYVGLTILEILLDIYTKLTISCVLHVEHLNSLFL